MSHLLPHGVHELSHLFMIVTLLFSSGAQMEFKRPHERPKGAKMTPRGHRMAPKLAPWASKKRSQDDARSVRFERHSKQILFDPKPMNEYYSVQSFCTGRLDQNLKQEFGFFENNCPCKQLV